jgi:hypothetical protein
MNKRVKRPKKETLKAYYNFLIDIYEKCINNEPFSYAYLIKKHNVSSTLSKVITDLGWVDKLTAKNTSNPHKWLLGNDKRPTMGWANTLLEELGKYHEYLRQKSWAKYEQPEQSQIKQVTKEFNIPEQKKTGIKLNCETPDLDTFFDRFIKLSGDCFELRIETDVRFDSINRRIDDLVKAANDIYEKISDIKEYNKLGFFARLRKKRQQRKRNRIKKQIEKLQTKIK